ncbi:VQ motif-containing protein 8, chloroplastic-like [Dioscorea cayenensis subsp. rotundata]|uniref:VQ motif-containing protein 8, chloroplastic-like n=1 Tax=Dioscorea cayennensis subsp. rotundata TaxID=55577 RepID=A0AB40CK02_DIOCR|nr:VQ motif-containing protein 8, chloroplastic-like [Dioscorea cayenensis subsp. rotundata]
MASSRRDHQIQGFRPRSLKVHKEYSWNSKKTMIVEANQRRLPPPHVIYLKSPKVIHVKPQDFMSIVQQLTGKSTSSSHVDVDVGVDVEVEERRRLAEEEEEEEEKE